MKKIYWRPPRASRSAHILIALVALLALISVESFPTQRKQRHYREKLAAARRARECLGAIKAAKTRLGIPIDPGVDPGRTGMIGQSITRVTSNTGHLGAKATSVNPNFAAVVVDMLKRAGISSGDTIAVGLSGSFPAMNVAVYSAIEALRLKPIIVLSVASSEWGANDENYMWPDMEKTLHESHLITFRAVAASRGGIDDRGFGMSKTGRALLDAAITRNDLDKIDSQSLADAVDKRMEIYERHAGDELIKAYINVGGGTASVGTFVGKKLFTAGLNFEAPRRGGDLVDAVLLRFVRQGIPVIHLTRISRMAERFGFPVDPVSMPPVGEGGVFVKEEPSMWLAIGGIVIIFGVMFMFIRFDIGLRILRTARRSEAKHHAEPMA